MLFPSSSRLRLLGLIVVVVSLLLLVVIPDGRAQRDGGGGEGGGKGDGNTTVFDKLIEIAVKETKWRKKIREALMGVPIVGESRKKLAQVFEDIESQPKDAEEGEETKASKRWVAQAMAVGNVLQGTGSLFTGVSNLMNSIMAATDRASGKIPSAPEPEKLDRATKGRTVSGLTVALSADPKMNETCQPCCMSPRRDAPPVVCMKSPCPVIPSDKTKCAKFPICLPPCRLEVTYNASKEVEEKEEEEDFEKRQSKKLKRGLRIFDMIFEGHCDNQTLCQHTVEVFNSLPNNITEEAREKLVDVLVYFKDVTKRPKTKKNRSAKDLTTPKLVKSLVGNLIFVAMKAKRMVNPVKPRGRSRSARIYTPSTDQQKELDKIMSDKNKVVEERDKLVAEKKAAWQKEADKKAEEEKKKKEADLEKQKREQPGLFWGAYCGVCIGTCETSFKDCEISCLNNFNCFWSKCVC